MCICYITTSIYQGVFPQNCSIFVPFAHITVHFSKYFSRCKQLKINVEGVKCSSGHGEQFFDAYIIDQLTYWIIDQIFEIELGRGNSLNRYNMQSSEVFRLKFAKMVSAKPIFGRKISIFVPFLAENRLS